MLKIYIQAYLWTVVLFQILDELLWSTWKFQFLRKSFKVYSMLSISCSLVGFFLNLTNTAAVCPFNTGTRMHWQVITGISAGTISICSSSMWPQIRSGSFSLFSSSPPMYGMMFPTISGQSLKVFPAPEIA